MVRLFARHRRVRRLHHGPHARTGLALPPAASREWCPHLLLLRCCALAELDLVGADHTSHGDELARRDHLRRDPRRDVRLALAALTVGSYRIATAPEPNSSRLTSFRSTCFDSPANNVGPWPASLGCTKNSYSSINPSSVNASGSFTPPTNSPLPDSRLSC